MAIKVGQLPFHNECKRIATAIEEEMYPKAAVGHWANDGEMEEGIDVCTVCNLVAYLGIRTCSRQVEDCKATVCGMYICRSANHYKTLAYI